MQRRRRGPMRLLPSPLPSRLPRRGAMALALSTLCSTWLARDERSRSSCGARGVFRRAAGTVQPPCREARAQAGALTPRHANPDDLEGMGFGSLSGAGAMQVRRGQARATQLTEGLPRRPGGPWLSAQVRGPTTRPHLRGRHHHRARRRRLVLDGVSIQVAARAEGQARRFKWGQRLRLDE